MPQTYDERIEIISQAVNKVNDDESLDLNNVSFAAISNEDNETMINTTKVWLDV